MMLIYLFIQKIKISLTFALNLEMFYEFVPYFTRQEDILGYKLKLNIKIKV